MDDGSFETAFAATMEWEGRLSKDPNDPGGTTMFGLSQRAHPRVEIEKLTLAEAKAIYLREYWQAAHLDQYPAPIRSKVFDLTVNVGPTTAVKIVQLACNRLGEQLHVDGIVGRLTLAACNARTKAGLLDAIRTEQALHYRRLVAGHPQLAKYLNGWLRRAAA